MTRLQPGAPVCYAYADDGEDAGPIIDGTMWLRGPLSDEDALRIADATAAEWERDERAVSVEHAHARNVPWRDGYDAGWTVCRSEPGRGAYPVAIVTMEVARG